MHPMIEAFDSSSPFHPGFCSVWYEPIHLEDRTVESSLYENAERFPTHPSVLLPLSLSVVVPFHGGE